MSTKFLITFLISIFILKLFVNTSVFGSKSIKLKNNNKNRLTLQNIYLMLKSFSSLHTSLEFFDRFKNNLDVDGFLGVRILNDQFNICLKILDQFGGQSYWNQIIGSNLRELIDQSQHLMTTVPTTIALNDQTYFKEVGVILEKGLWAHIPDKHLSINESKEYKFTLKLNEIPLNENLSDFCVSQMLKTCHISRFCWELMTSPGYQDYPLSHQVFYLELTKMKCKANSKTIDSLLTKFCTNMYLENMRIQGQSFPEEYIDLFMENIAFCGIIGFKEFTENKNWLRQILSRQTTNGCFTRNLHTSRLKRRDKILENGCSSHKTSMALASTVVYLRDIILDFI